MKILLQSTIIFFAAVSIVMNPVLPAYSEEDYIDDKAEQVEHMRKYAEEIGKHIDETLDQLDKQRTFFVEDQAQQAYADYNKSILEMRQLEVDLMKKMVKAASENDVTALELLEQEKNKVSHEIYLIELKKEKESTINGYNKDYNEYIEDSKVKLGIQLIEQSYDDIISAHEALYSAEQNVKEAYDKKEKAVKLMDVYLLEAQKNKKIKELSQ